MDWILKKRSMKKVNAPTKITFARIGISVFLLLAIFVMYIVDEFNPFIFKANIYLTNDKINGPYLNYIMLIIFVLFLTACLTDFLDGYLARKNNLVTDLGKFLDPLADKMLINSLSIFLVFSFASINNSSKIPFFCVIIMVIRDLVVDGLRFVCAKKGKTIQANIYGKLKTVFQMVMIGLILFNGFPFSFFDINWPKYLHITDFVCYITTLTSFISGVIYVKQNIHLIVGGDTNE